MIRTYCDNCGQEITADLELKPQGLPLQLKLVVRSGGDRINQPVVFGQALYNKSHYGNGKDPEHICLHCIIDSFQQLDKRPKAPVDTRKRLEEASIVEIHDHLRRIGANIPMPMPDPVWMPPPIMPAPPPMIPPHELRD